MENLQELYEDTIRDIYNAEKQLLKAMPKLLGAAQNPQLKAAIETHIGQTEVQIGRLERVAELGTFKPHGKVCKVAQGLVEEATEHLEEGRPGATLDAAIISCAQKNEHYEICSYGTVVAWAEALGYDDAATLLEESLEEERQTDKMLGEISDVVNAQAVKGGDSSSEEVMEDDNSEPELPVGDVTGASANR